MSNVETSSRVSGEAGGQLEERKRGREHVIIDVMYYELEVQRVFEHLSNLCSNEQDQADYFLTRAGDSYWRRLEYANGSMK